MAAQYFPRNDPDLIIWLTNYGKELEARGKGLELTDAQIQTAVKLAKELMDSIQTDEQQYAEWQAANAKTAELRRKTLPELQNVLDRCRTSSVWRQQPDQHERAFMATAPSSSAALFDNSKPALRVQALPGKVRVHWTRGRLDGIHVYVRRPGETWRMLGRDNRPPFDDLSAVEKPGTPEPREYRIIGVYHDEEVGLPSDIASIVVGG